MINENPKYVIGIDVGGTKIACALADLEGNIINQFNIPTEADKDTETVLNNIIYVIKEMLHMVKYSQIKAIGIGIAGVLDVKNGIVIESPNLPFKNYPLVEILKNLFFIDIYLENDGNVAAIGEFVKGSGVGTNNMLFVTVSTGIGGGAILNGKLYRGNGNAFEIGHMTVEPKGEMCKCGNVGCLEMLSSGTAISEVAKRYVKNGWGTSLKQYENITAREVFKEAENGDAIAHHIVNVSMNYLGVGIANLVNIFNPEMIVIGGGVSQVGDVLFDKAREVVNKRCFRVSAEGCKIVKAKLGGDAGVMGSVILALNDGIV